MAEDPNVKVNILNSVASVAVFFFCTSKCFTVVVVGVASLVFVLDSYCAVVA